jgi:hypothetical protein
MHFYQVFLSFLSILICISSIFFTCISIKKITLEHTSQTMKKYLLFIFLLSMSFGANSQILMSLIFGDKLNSDGLEFGLDGGINLSNISGLDGNKVIAPLNIGFYFDIRIKNQWSFYTGVLVKSELGVNELSMDDLEFLNARIYEDGGSYSQRIRYFLVPTLIKYAFDNYIYVEGGPMFGLMTNAWIQYETDTDGFESRVKEFNKDDINRFEMGVALGIGYRLKGKGWSFGVRFYNGFTNIYKNRSGTHNRALFFKVNVPIGAKKAKETQANDDLEQ